MEDAVGISERAGYGYDSAGCVVKLDENVTHPAVGSHVIGATNPINLAYSTCNRYTTAPVEKDPFVLVDEGGSEDGTIAIQFFKIDKLKYFVDIIAEAVTLELFYPATGYTGGGYIGFELSLGEHALLIKAAEAG
ncbi:hypothetical protein F4679DRAFT_577762 [Xylaria curta]|nr:hypothetical protein F4679DRAFT_577762 [Xylaria curta]